MFFLLFIWSLLSESFHSFWQKILKVRQVSIIDLKGMVELFVDVNQKTGHFFVLDNRIIIKECVEIPKSQIFWLVVFLSKRYEILQNLITVCTVFVEMIQQDNFNPFLSSQKLSHTFSNNFRALMMIFFRYRFWGKVWL